jgi:alpha-1,2-mannosyltransferase
MDAKILSTFSTPRARQIFLFGLVLFFLGLSIQYTIKVTGSERATRSAFLRWRNQILDLDNGEDIYLKHDYPNPPIMALLLRPLAGLPRLVGCLAWFYLKVGMVFLVLHWVLRMVEDPARPFPVWARAIATIVSIRPIMGDLTHGNINIFLLFLVVAALFAFRHRRDFLAGLLLGLAIACKVTPALFLPYFVWKRAWTTLAGCAAGLVLFLWLIPGAILGFDYNASLLTQWTRQMVVPFVVHGEVTTEHQNQSLPGLVHRLFTEEPSFTVWTEDGYVPVAHHNILNLDREILRWGMKLCLLLFAAVVVWSCRTPIRVASPAANPRFDQRLAVEYSLILLGMLLFSERTWKHHCVTLVLPFAVLVYHLAVVPLSRKRWRYLLASLIGAIALIMTTSSGILGPAADAAAELAEVYGAYVWANLVLMAALVNILRWSRNSVPAVGSQDAQVLSLRITGPESKSQEREHAGSLDSMLS